MLLEVLRQRDDSKVKLPTEAQIRKCQATMKDKCPTLTIVTHVGDGLNNFVQNCFHNRWTHDHCIENLFVFAPDGTVTMAIPNAPGSMHDSKLAFIGQERGNLVCNKIDHLHEKCGMQAAMDSAFAAQQRASVIKSFMQKHITLLGPNNAAVHYLADLQQTSQQRSFNWKGRYYF